MYYLDFDYLYCLGDEGYGKLKALCAEGDRLTMTNTATTHVTFEKCDGLYRAIITDKLVDFRFNLFNRDVIELACNVQSFIDGYNAALSIRR